MKIIFDLDGTLIDISERHWSVYKDILQAMHKQSLKKDEYWALKRENVSWPEILAKSDIASDQTEEFLLQFIQKIETIEWLKVDTPFKETKNVLEHLSQHELYLVSLRHNHANFLKQIEWLGIKDYFISIHSGHTDDSGHHKKHEIIKEIVSGEKAIIIGDTETDILAAQALGLPSVAVSSGIRSEIFLQNLNPTHLIENITQFPELVSV